MSAALPNGRNGTFRFIAGAFVLCQREKERDGGSGEMIGTQSHFGKS